MTSVSKYCISKQQTSNGWSLSQLIKKTLFVIWESKELSIGLHIKFSTYPYPALVLCIAGGGGWYVKPLTMSKRTLDYSNLCTQLYLTTRGRSKVDRHHIQYMFILMRMVQYYSYMAAFGESKVETIHIFCIIIINFYIFFVT